MGFYLKVTKQLQGGHPLRQEKQPMQLSPSPSLEEMGCPRGATSTANIALIGRIRVLNLEPCILAPG